MRDELKNLKLIRLISPIHVPRPLVDQIADRKYSVDDWYKFLSDTLTIATTEGVRLNPLSHLYLIQDPDNQPIGFLWYEVDALSRDLVVKEFSIIPKLWFKGEAVQVIVNHVVEIKSKAKLNRILYMCPFPSIAKKYGFYPIKTSLMEYNENHKENTHGKLVQPTTEGKAESAECTECESSDT